jgi:hypothetical protein
MCVLAALFALSAVTASAQGSGSTFGPSTDGAPVEYVATADQVAADEVELAQDLDGDGGVGTASNGEDAVVLKDFACGIPTPAGGVAITFDSHAVVTPSGNSHLVCRGEFPAGPPMAIVLEDFPCFVFRPGGGLTLATSSHATISSSGQVTLVCHLKS